MHADYHKEQIVQASLNITSYNIQTKSFRYYKEIISLAILGTIYVFLKGTADKNDCYKPMLQPCRFQGKPDCSTDSRGFDTHLVKMFLISKGLKTK